ncbi:nitroreductase family protein [Novosphingobium sp. THN1]|uniref:nitroreductase family protein n=1 Tax=Novosphingobium sp. THN1 TaxID=1016987 RepID=UPI0013C34FB6|nr:nitroreductase family protein [Novosphingobium sp. THN1]
MLPAPSFAIRTKAALRPYWRHIRDLSQLARFCAYDFNRFRRLSGTFPLRMTPGAEAARITKYYHMIEKGLALPAPRPGFGHYAIGELCALLDKAINEGRSGEHVERALDSLLAYRAFNSRHGGATPGCLDHTLANAQARKIACIPDAIKQATRAEILEATAFDAERFFWTRYSVRQFGNAPVAYADIEAAVRIAQSSPSVCNRQSARVHIITDPSQCAALLRFQNGNRGFGETMGALAIITADLSHFVEPTERYQPWIDGGLFAMTFALGLHARGLGSCFLNWSASIDSDRGLRAAMRLPDEETVIAFLAIGTLRDAFTVARSPRKALSDVMDTKNFNRGFK